MYSTSTESIIATLYLEEERPLDFLLESAAVLLESYDAVLRGAARTADLQIKKTCSKIIIITNM